MKTDEEYTTLAARLAAAGMKRDAIVDWLKKEVPQKSHGWAEHLVPGGRFKCRARAQEMIDGGAVRADVIVAMREQFSDLSADEINDCVPRWKSYGKMTREEGRLYNLTNDWERLALEKRQEKLRGWERMRTRELERRAQRRYGKVGGRFRRFDSGVPEIDPAASYVSGDTLERLDKEWQGVESGLYEFPKRTHPALDTATGLAFAQKWVNPTTVIETAYAWLDGAIGEIEDIYDPPVTLALLGPPGSGKTTLAAYLVGVMVATSDREGFYSFRWLRCKDEGKAGEITNEHREVDLLVLDNLSDSSSPKRRADLEQLVHWRHEEQKSIIVTSTMTPTAIESHYGTEVARRLVADVAVIFQLTLPE